MAITNEKRNLENISKLADHTKAAALKWHSYLVANNIDVLIYSTIRTLDEQRANVKNGVSKTMKSYHLVGQALDFVPVGENGKLDWDGYSLPEVKLAIAEAKRLGFEWGGDWTSFVDKPHLQFNYKGYATDTFTADNPIPVIVKPVATQVKAAAVEVASIVPFPGVLKRGSKGKDVERVQRALGLKVDGDFGPATARAVKAYQSRKGLVADGIIGSKTWAVMF